MAKEKWVIPTYKGIEFNNYLISNLGRIATNQLSPKNLKKETIFGNYKLMETVPQNRGYVEVYPYTNDKVRKYILLHRLVWESFICEIPKEFVIDHKNANKIDNRLANLQLITHSENILKYHKKDKKRKNK
jgi:hypothetical protein